MQKNCTLMKLLHIKCFPLTTFHKMWSQFLFLILIVKVKPRSLNFRVMKDLSLWPCFHFPVLPSQEHNAHRIPPSRGPIPELLCSWTAEGGQRLLLTLGLIVGSWDLEGISTVSVKFHFKIQTRSGPMRCGFFLFYGVLLPLSFTPGKSLLLLLFKFHTSSILTRKYQFGNVIFY